MTRAFAAILALGLTATVAAGCTEPTKPTATEKAERPTVTADPRNTAPVAHAGWDFLVRLAEGAVLNGSAGDAEDNVESYSWKKVSGPDSYSIESPRSMTTKVGNLERGVYEFELTVIDSGGLEDTDTAGIIVYDPHVQSVNEVVYRNIPWECPMGCSANVADIRPFTSRGGAISVLAQDSGATEWIAVPPMSEWTPQTKYVWAMSGFVISVYGDHETRAVNVKIVY